MEYARIQFYLQQSKNIKELIWSIVGPPEWKPQQLKQLTSQPTSQE